MEYEVLIFGRAAKAAGGDRVRVTISPRRGEAGRATAGEVLSAMAEQFPQLEFALLGARLAVNHSFAGAETPVGPGDELALISLVAGG
jgi:molybdopterin converting factor small subunit